METDKDMGSSCLGESLNDVNVDVLSDNSENSNQNHGRVSEISSLSQESSVEHHDVLPDSFSQDAQRLPDSQEIQLMDTSGATLKRKDAGSDFRWPP